MLVGRDWAQRFLVEQPAIYHANDLRALGRAIRAAADPRPAGHRRADALVAICNTDYPRSPHRSGSIPINDPGEAGTG